MLIAFRKYFLTIAICCFNFIIIQQSCAADEQSFKEITDKTEAFYAGYFQVVGHGEGESKSMALLAARSIAQAELIGIINGIQIERKTAIKNGKIDVDVILARSQGMIKFASVCGEKYDSKSGEAEVCLKLELRSGGLGDLVEGLIDNVK
ncbi:hypothetical protein [Maridesulfovibrio bastinii]|uniref:hypothetical protein n=1 Tax=Maridesulfovibrio bastinii TaxID=47157 RepID=UPI0012EBD450|nr:hypothetical protein [Maridesulfovibrio bastinii]